MRAVRVALCAALAATVESSCARDVPFDIPLNCRETLRQQDDWQPPIVGDVLEAAEDHPAVIAFVLATKDIAIATAADEARLRTACMRPGDGAGPSATCEPLTAEAIGPALLDSEPSCATFFSDEAACLASCASPAGLANTAGGCQSSSASCADGPLDVECEGGCTPNGQVPLTCLGTCEGDCLGTCTGTSSCDGSCDGECINTGTDGGRRPDGSCIGECRGTCRMQPGRSTICRGTCAGTCNADCVPAEGTALVRCDGQCRGTSTPLTCRGQTTVSCRVRQLCTAACTARAIARAACSVPRVIRASGVDAALDAELASSLAGVLLVRARSARLAEAAQRLLDVLAADPIRAAGRADQTESSALASCIDHIATTTRSAAERARQNRAFADQALERAGLDQ